MRMLLLSRVAVCST